MKQFVKQLKKTLKNSLILNKYKKGLCSHKSFFIPSYGYLLDDKTYVLRLDNKSNSLYIKKILEMLGAVILGSKPAEIINVPGSKEDKKIKLSQIEAFFSNCSRITYRIITTHDGGKRVLFINEKSMEKEIQDMVNDANKKIEAKFKEKEQELLTV